LPCNGELAIEHKSIDLIDASPLVLSQLIRWEFITRALTATVWVHSSSEAIATSARLPLAFLRADFNWRDRQPI
jgi:hypothetical protein